MATTSERARKHENVDLPLVCFASLPPLVFCLSINFALLLLRLSRVWVSVWETHERVVPTERQIQRRLRRNKRSVRTKKKKWESNRWESKRRREKFELCAGPHINNEICLGFNIFVSSIIDSKRTSRVCCDSFRIHIIYLYFLNVRALNAIVQSPVLVAHIVTVIFKLNLLWFRL